MGRGAGKTRVGAEWVLNQVATGQAKRIALVAPTAFDARTVMVEGESGILACSPPWNRPRYEPSRCKLVWANGAIATTYSADCPERLRGPQADSAWIDEIGSWRRIDAWNNLMLGLRLGKNPRVCATTTPRATTLVKQLIADPNTVIAYGTTFDNSDHLATQFLDQITARFKGTRLGRQELYGELLEIVEGQWFANYDPDEHVRPEAEYHPSFPVRLAIDAGVSRHTAAVWFQVQWLDDLVRRVTVFKDFHCEGAYAAQAAEKIREANEGPPNYGRVDAIRLDPAAVARTGIGPAAYNEYELVFGSRITGKWPSHSVLDGLDQIEMLLDTGNLLIHPRCKHVDGAFSNYARKEQMGTFLEEPADPQHPWEDIMDALRGGLRDAMPGGRESQKNFRTVHGSQI